MGKPDYKTFFNGVRNDFKIAVDDLFNAIEIIRDDVEELKASKKSDKLES